MQFSPNSQYEYNCKPKLSAQWQVDIFKKSCPLNHSLPVACRALQQAETSPEVFATGVRNGSPAQLHSLSQEAFLDVTSTMLSNPALGY